MNVNSRGHNLDTRFEQRFPEIKHPPVPKTRWVYPPLRFNPKFVKMSYGPKSRVLFIARIERIVTATQNNDLIVSAPMVRLSNAPPPIT